MSKVNDILDDLLETQTLIHQTRARYQTNRLLFTKEQMEFFDYELDKRQAKVDEIKALIEKELDNREVKANELEMLIDIYECITKT